MYANELNERRDQELREVGQRIELLHSLLGLYLSTFKVDITFVQKMIKDIVDASARQQLLKCITYT
jgi:endonuclease V-like protein UPF0215 family